MNPFQAMMLEGVFSKQEPLQVETPQGIVLVDEALVPYEGQEVIVSLHHIPELPLKPDAWGGGCCQWSPHPCPTGHHLPEYRNRLFAQNLEGVLVNVGGVWAIESFSGDVDPLHLDALAGHLARLGCVTKFSAEQMRESLAQSGHLDAVESMGVKLSELQSVLENLKNG